MVCHDTRAQCDIANQCLRFRRELSLGLGLYEGSSLESGAHLREQCPRPGRSLQMAHPRQWYNPAEKKISRKGEWV